MGCHLSYVITQCYLPPKQVNTPCLTPARQAWYSINLPGGVEGLSWPRWLCTYQDSLPVSRQSPIQVVTKPTVEQVHWLRPLF